MIKYRVDEEMKVWKKYYGDQLSEKEKDVEDMKKYYEAEFKKIKNLCER